VVAAILDEGSDVPAWLTRLGARGVAVETLFLPPRRYLAERRFVRSVLQRYQVSIVHTHGYRADVLHSGVAARLGIPQVSTAHGFASTGAKGRFFEWLQLRSWRRIGAVVAVSRALVDVLARAGIPRERIECIANGIVDDEAPPMERLVARRALGLPPSGPVAGWIGRLSGEKAPDVAIRALSACRDRSIHLGILGDGPMMQRCRDLVGELGLDSRVTFAGFTADASRHLRAFDLLVLSSHTEGTPMVLLEAAAARLPIVATSVGGVPDLLAASGALLVPPADPEALGRAIDSAVSDPIAAESRADAAHARVSSMTAADDWVGRYLALYDRVLSSSPGARTSRTPPSA
jgi:glycosyltransferase involved in cell wall biosynthesis